MSSASPLVSVPLGPCADFVVYTAGALTLGAAPNNADTGSIGVAGVLTGSPTFTSGSVEQASPRQKACQGVLASTYQLVVGLPACATISAELGGMTLTPGVYCAATFRVTTLSVTFDAQNVPASQWVLRSDTTWVMAATTSFVLINGAQACNIFFTAATTATFGANSAFSGTLLAQGAVTFGAACTIKGRALSLGAVTFGAASYLSLPPQYAAVAFISNNGATQPYLPALSTYFNALSAQYFQTVDITTIALTLVATFPVSALYDAFGTPGSTLVNTVGASPAITLPTVVSALAAGVGCSMRSSLFAWYPFSGTVDDQLDLVTAGNVPAGQRPSLTTDRFGQANSVYHFTAASNTWVVSTGTNIAAESFAISLWFRTSSNSNSIGMFMYCSSARVCDRIVMSTGSVIARLYDGETITSPRGTYNDGVWHHCVWQHLTTIIAQQLWIDRILVVVGALTLSNVAGSTSNTMYIGNGMDPTGSAGWPWEGDLDDVAVLNRPMSAAEIKDMWSVAAPTGTNPDGHCISVSISPNDGWSGFNVKPALLTGLALRSYTNDGLGSTLVAGLTLAPALSPTLNYTAVSDVYTSGLTLNVTHTDPGTVWGSVNGGASVPLTSGQWTTPAPTFTGLPANSASVVKVVTSSITYRVMVMRPLSDVTSIGVQCRDASGVSSDLSVGLTPAYQSGLTPNYAVTVPYQCVTAALRIGYTAGPVRIVFNGAASTVLAPSGAFSPQYALVYGVDNVFSVASADTLPLRVRVSRTTPSVTSISFGSMPSGTVVPFVSGVPGSYLVAVQGDMGALSVTGVYARGGSMTVQANGLSYGAPASGSVVNLAPALVTSPNSVIVILNSTDGNWVYTFAIGCPLPYSCVKSDNQAVTGCEYNCIVCLGSIVRRVCLLPRPACCGMPGCQC